jgi:hypothetical protein
MNRSGSLGSFLLRDPIFCDILYIEEHSVFLQPGISYWSSPGEYEMQQKYLKKNFLTGEVLFFSRDVKSGRIFLDEIRIDKQIDIHHMPACIMCSLTVFL